jgi:hypothetical protein
MRFFGNYPSVPTGTGYCVNTKSREKEHRGGEGADKKKAIHYSD